MGKNKCIWAWKTFLAISPPTESSPCSDFKKNKRVLTKAMNYKNLVDFWSCFSLTPLWTLVRYVYTQVTQLLIHMHLHTRIPLCSFSLRNLFNEAPSFLFLSSFSNPPHTELRWAAHLVPLVPWLTQSLSSSPGSPVQRTDTRWLHICFLWDLNSLHRSCFLHATAHLRSLQ